MNEQTTRAEAIRKLAGLIKDIRVAMMTTCDDEGHLRSRPMATQETEFDGDLWFFTGASSPKAVEVQHNAAVNLSYADPGSQTYISVSGTATIVRDRQKAEELWNPMYKAWFPGGLDDPDLALIKVDVEKAEYWDSPSSPVAHIVGLTGALLKGETYQPGDNQKMDL